MKIILLMCGVLTLFSCEDRERLNPLDPANELSHGAPTGLKAITQKDTVNLRWNPFDVNHMAAYEIYRGQDAQDLALHHVLSSEFNEFQENGLSYNRPYFYAIRAVTEFSQSGRSRPVKTIPGPYSLWVADMYNFFLHSISFDGTQKQKTLEFKSPRSLVKINKDLLVSDYFEKRIYKVSPEVKIKVLFSLPDSPIDVALDNEANQLYILLEDSTVRGYTLEGTLVWTLTLGLNPNLSSELAFDTQTESLWISLNEQNKVIRVSPLGQIMVEIENIPNPGPLKADPINGGVWVTTENGIMKQTPQGEQYRYRTHLFIHDISIHPETGDCYYTGSRGGVSDWETGVLPLENPENPVIILNDSVQWLYNIQVVPSEGETGIFVQQAFEWKLLRFNATGEKLGELETFNSRLDFILY